MTYSTTLPRRHLADAVAWTSRGDYVRVEQHPGSLAVVGADLYTTVVTTLRCGEKGDACAFTFFASCTLPAKLLLATCKALQGDDAEVAVVASRLRLRSGGYRGEVAAQGRLPAVPAVPADLWVDLSPEQAGQLCSALRAAAAAALSDPARPAVSGVRVDVGGGDGTVRVVGTDGARLHLVEVADAGAVVARSFTLPAQCVGAVCDVLAESGGRQVPARSVKRPKKADAASGDGAPAPAALPRVQLAVGKSNLAVRAVLDATDARPFAERAAYCRLAPEPYSEWRRVVEAQSPRTTAAVLVLGRDVLLSVLKSCPADAVALSVGHGGNLQIDYVVLDDTSTRRLGEGGVVVDVLGGGLPVAAPSFSVKVSTAYLRDAVAECGSDVELVLSPSQPVRLRSGSFSAVVMFVR